MSREPAVKSATRVFEILEQFREARRPLCLSDIAEKGRYPISSTAALLKSMTSQGYLSFGASSRTYMPTVRLQNLVSWVSTVSWERGPVLEAMEELRESTGELVVLATINDVHAEYVEACRSTQAVQLWSPPGTKRPLVQSGPGWMLLSRLPPRLIEKVYRRTVALSEISEVEFPLDALQVRVDACRMAGSVFASDTDFVRSTVHRGGGMISMLVPEAPGQRPLAIGVGGPRERLAAHQEEITAALDRTVRHLERAAGALSL
ncbi:IclR family transcriptional regulator [Roseomonas sp. BN140053]|uniref:IclR family transcriptional regulator n=1 Tax=Roseomonas sp. BN140053 TaxID=3391898 RepID=UPI0039E73EC9